MSTKWIVDRNIFEDNKIPAQEFKNLKIKYFEFDYVSFLRGKMEKELSSIVEPVIVYGSLNTVHNMQNFYGCYFDNQSFNTNVYMSLFGTDFEQYLNEDHIYSTFSNLMSKPKYYYELFNKNRLFFRPASGNKSFTGCIIHKKDIVQELNAIKQLYNISKKSMILISTYKHIYEESRFIIGNRKIIDHSRYIVNDEITIDQNTDECAFMFVEDIIENTEWQPYDLYAIDIAMTNNGPKIIELNSFATSGWYGMNTSKIIERASSITKENFEKDKLYD